MYSVFLIRLNVSISLGMDCTTSSTYYVFFIIMGAASGYSSTYFSAVCLSANIAIMPITKGNSRQNVVFREFRNIQIAPNKSMGMLIPFI